MVLPRMVGPVLLTAVVLAVLVAALLLALVDSVRRMVSTSPTRRALRSAHSYICGPCGKMASSGRGVGADNSRAPAGAGLGAFDGRSPHADPAKHTGIVKKG